LVVGGHPVATSLTHATFDGDCLPVTLYVQPALLKDWFVYSEKAAPVVA
jgi:hypothetical protein